MKKIIMLGSHGTGKSVLSESLLKKLVEEFPNQKTVMFDGFADETRKRGHSLNIFESQVQAIKAQLVLLRIYLNAIKTSDADVAIIPDNIGRQLIYSTYNSMAEEFIDLLKDFFKEEVKNSVVIYIPIEFALPWDRHPHQSFHRQIDELTLEILQDNQISYLEVKGTVEERTELAMEVLREFCKPEVSTST